MIMGAIIAMAALLTIALAANRNVASYPEGSPEAALQQFVSASLDEDEDAMLLLLTDQMRSRCTALLADSGFDRSWSGTSLRADLAEIEVDGDRAEAMVRFQEGNNDDPFDSSSWDFERRYVLVESDGSWFIERAGWPDAFDNCTRGEG